MPRVRGWFEEDGTGRLGSTSRFGPAVDRPPTLWITTIGRKSGRSRETALIFVADGPNLIVAASNAGEPSEPAWSLNLRARPATEVRLGRDRRAMRAREASALEAARLWPLLDAVYPTFARYRARTNRTIAVVVLEPATGSPTSTATAQVPTSPSWQLRFPTLLVPEAGFDPARPCDRLIRDRRGSVRRILRRVVSFVERPVAG